MARPRFKSWKKAKSGSNPVSSALRAQAMPYQGQIRHANQQFNADRQLENRLLTASQRSVGGYDNAASALSAEQLNRAANLAGRTATDAAEAREWLGGLFADTSGPTGPTVGTATAAANATRLGSEVALNEQQRQGLTQLTRTGMLARRNEAVREAREKQRTAVQAARDQINAIAATRPLLDRQFKREDLENALMRQEIRLNQQRFAMDRDLADADIAASAAATAAAGGGGGGGKPNAATARARGAIGKLNTAFAAARERLGSGLGQAESLAPLDQLGLRNRTHYNLVNGTIRLTPEGVRQYFGVNSSLAPNQVFYAARAFDPWLGQRLRLFKQNGKWRLSWQPEGQGPPSPIM